MAKFAAENARIIGIFTESNMRIIFLGDIMLGRGVNDLLKKVAPDCVWGNTLPILVSADARIANLECVLSDGGSPARKVFTFRSNAKNVAVLKAASIDAVTLANNHSLDYGSEALADTIGILEQEKIGYAGAGVSLEKAQTLATIKIGVLTIGLLAVTDSSEPGWAAEKNKPGVWFLPINPSHEKAQALFERVRRARQEVNMLVVSLHWGTNWGYKPEAGHQAFAKALVDAGADIVFGHSSHVCRGVEIYKSKPIIYSAGNFIDDYAINEIERNDESFIFAVDTTGEEVKKVSMYPVIISDCRVNVAVSERVGSMVEWMTELSIELGSITVWSDVLGTLDIEIK
jgi:poly-gamma-glutamate synthesis protein (capsule biosynthesis protein)